MVVPAAGAVLAIIEGLQAAWGTVSKILAAIDKFITFLKAIKGGGAGPQFAAAVAAGAVAVIDFVANWLLQRLMKPAKKVSGKLAAMAKKIMAKLKKGLKKVGKKLKKAFKSAKKKVKGLFKKKGKGKKKGGKKKDRKDDDKAKKDKANLKKLKRADKAIKRALRRPTPDAKAKALIQRIAAQNGVKASISGGKKGLNVTLSINPSLSEFFGREDVEGIRTRIKELGIKANDLGDELDKAINALRRDEGATGTKQELTQQVLEREGGLEGFVGNREFEARSAKGDNKGHDRQKQVNAGLAAQAAADEDLFHMGGGEMEGAGSDALMINMATGEVTNLEIKAKNVPNMTPMASSRDLPAKGSVPFKPMPGTEGSTLSQRHLGIGPGGNIADPQTTRDRADELAGPPGKPGKALETPEGGGMENKLSSVSENVVTNLQTRLNQLEAAITSAQSSGAQLDGEDKAAVMKAIAKMERAATTLRNVVTGVSGKLRLVAAPPPGKRQKEPAARYIAEALTLLEAGRRKFQRSVKDSNVAVEIAVIELDDNGREVSVLGKG